MPDRMPIADEEEGAAGTAAAEAGALANNAVEAAVDAAIVALPEVVRTWDWAACHVSAVGLDLLVTLVKTDRDCRRA
jgi:hypothetical protein